LRESFVQAKRNNTIGGASVLQKLSDLASACVVGVSAAQDAVAFALSELLARHPEDRDERVVTGENNYVLLSLGEDHLSEAVNFIQEAGTADEAVRIIAALARIVPDRLNNRWPPEISGN
jgi:hypothetical protein